MIQNSTEELVVLWILGIDVGTSFVPGVGISRLEDVVEGNSCAIRLHGIGSRIRKMPDETVAVAEVRLLDL